MNIKRQDFSLAGRAEDASLEDLQQNVVKNSNDSKCEVMYFSRKFSGQGPVPQCVHLCADDIIISHNVVCYHWAMMDSTRTMSSHVSKLCKSVSFALWKISRIRTL